jgi:SAM-dependent methyltransferase
MQFDLKEKFDVIIAGELIEHIENSGIFLENVKKHLNKGGIFFISTPNATSFRFGFYALFNREPEYEGHIKYFTKDSLGLMLKNHFPSCKIGFCNLTTNIQNKNWVWKFKFNVENFIGMIIPRYSPNLYAFCKNEK